MPETTPPSIPMLEPSDRGTLLGQRGLPLAWARWEHPHPKGRVVISHGYGEHGERYGHTAQWLLGLGWSVSSLDHVGFGRSGGPRGDAHGIRPFAEDLAQFLRQERLHDTQRAGLPLRLVEGAPLPPLPSGPLVVLGHSFGGLVALLCLLWHGDALDGLILSSPALALRPHQGLQLTLLAKVLIRVRPHLQVSLQNQKPRVCSDPEMVARYEADPLCHRWATAAFGAALEEGRAELLPFGAELDRPILLLESGEDTVVDLDASEGLWSALRPGMLERHRLPGVFHEIFHDRQRAGAEALAASWLDRLRSAWNPSHRSAMTEVPPPESA